MTIWFWVIIAICAIPGYIITSHLAYRANVREGKAFYYMWAGITISIFWLVAKILGIE